MKKKTTEPEEAVILGEDKEGKIVTFKEFQEHRLGLKGKPPEQTEDWLSDMPVGTTFISGERSYDPFLQEYTILSKSNKVDSGVVVELELQLGNKPIVPVDPLLFCQRFRLIAIRGRYIYNE